MPKIKPLLLFIIASIALHWWVLSLPIFQRIKHLESSSTLNTSPAIVAKITDNQPSLALSKNNVADASNKENLETINPSQALPPPSLLRGSPWLRRPAENRSRNFGDQPPLTAFTQVENALQGVTTESSSNLQCKRIGFERLFICQDPNNIEQSEKITKVLNQLSNTSISQMPDCIILEASEKKWHAKACHS